MWQYYAVAMRMVARYYVLTIEIAVAVIVPILIGRWLDGKTGREPWFTIAGMILGGAAAVRSAQRAYTEMLRDQDKGASTEKKAEEKQKR
jgi:F0F1-type ATP synthase assembly protein I